MFETEKNKPPDEQVLRNDDHDDVPEVEEYYCEATHDLTSAALFLYLEASSRLLKKYDGELREMAQPLCYGRIARPIGPWQAAHGVRD